MSDYTDDLAAVENSLRRVIEHIGRDLHGEHWLMSFGIPVSAIKNWEKHQKRESAARSNGIQETRLIYYSDFADLEKIIKENWPSFEPVFINKERTIVYLDKLRELRNPDAHHRELTQAEKALVTGMAGELRTEITRYLSVKDTPDEYFPHLDALRDNLGNFFGDRNDRFPILRVGDVLEFIAEAWDPEGAELEFRWSTNAMNDQRSYVSQDWSTNNRFTWKISEKHIADPAMVYVDMRGPRIPHAQPDYDGRWSLHYTVLPAR